MVTTSDETPEIYSGNAENGNTEEKGRGIKRGILHFRCDDEMSDSLLRVAEFKNLPVGTMVRAWVAERLRQEIVSLPLTEVHLPNGKVITAKSYRGDIERILESDGSDGINLTRKEKMTLLYWLDGISLSANE